MERKRADVRLVELNLAPSREKAKALIMAGQVLCGTQRIEKPGELVEEEAPLTVKEHLPYVSRGGLKLEKVIREKSLVLQGLTCVDVGASTGGFTDCMLQHGAQKVYAIDVGYGQLDYRLRQDERVTSWERTNIRYFDPEKILEPVGFVSIDVSFLSLSLVLPVVKEILEEKARFVALIKPQFEAGREKVGKKGIVRDSKVHLEVLQKVDSLLEQLDLCPLGYFVSPIHGTQGNKEFLVYGEKSPYHPPDVDCSALVKEEPDAS